ncbi:unnamed protein product [Staurois parvus]|uniref:Uncharacterized protein n=1 Tax=Staurois parvus TaxID=386267 RepID=A0ABN9BXY3_9NEOB|nr:unnamed protein product [Staurois parvus]
MGPRTGLPSCCCQARNLAMGPRTRRPHAAARSKSVSWVPVRPPIAAVSIATLCPCATFRSPPHTAGVSIFVIGC